MKMKQWIVVEYEQIDVSTFGDKTPQSHAGAVTRCAPVVARSEDEAIAEVAGGEGWYAAFELPVDLTPRKLALVLDQVAD